MTFNFSSRICKLAIAAGAVALATQVHGQTNVTTTGGTSGQVPVFNGKSSVLNSNIYTTSFGIGINHGPGTGIAFDVLGKMVVRGIFDLGRTNDATTSAGASSNVLQFHSQAYNTTKAAYLNPFFEFRSEPIGNNSATTGAKFNVLYSDGTATEAETGLSINGNGTINFAPGQTFPSTANGITSVVHDSSLTGNGVSGSPLGIASVGHDANFTGNGTSASPLALAATVNVGALNASQAINAVIPDTNTSVFTPAVQGIDNSGIGEGVRGLSYANGSNNSGYGGVFQGNIGLYSQGNQYAATLYGNVYVSGTLSKAGGSFKIDDPIDPENKYLSHSFVESPDMMNIYNGNATTDGSGMATVTMPDWFEALNQDFRYQLTPIGQFSQAIVASEMENNTFTIKTDKPNVKVSWQVTGVRHDAWANANRIPVEEEKTEAERGRYLNPEAFHKSQKLRITRPSSPTHDALVRAQSLQ